jgi:NAD(P)-dependent dehydrogenase (short-subunit alcohol dehydrogenase family)
MPRGLRAEEIMARFDDTVAVIVGGGTLIGQTIARAFAAEGARVAVGDIDEKAGAATAAGLGERGWWRRLDLARDDDIAAFAAGAVGRFGRVDCLVNVACSYADGGVATTRAQWLQSLNVNVAGAALMVQALRPELARSRGAVVNFGSVAAKGARVDTLAYPTAKAAVLHLSRCLALALAPDGIRVNTVSPGWTWSRPLVERTGDDRAWAARAAAPLHMTRRFAEPEEVAACVLFLCSPAASCVTGTDLAADGGYAAMGPDRGISSGNQLLATKA